MTMKIKQKIQKKFLSKQIATKAQNMPTPLEKLPTPLETLQRALGKLQRSLILKKYSFLRTVN